MSEVQADCDTTRRWLRPLPRAPLSESNPIVLLADPDPAAMAVLADLLAVSELVVVTCPDGAASIYQIGRLQPAAAVIGLCLPGVPAATVIRTARLYTDLPIAVGVDAGQMELVAPALAAGASQVLSRPYRHRELRLFLAPHLARARSLLEREATITLGAITLDGPAYEIRISGRPIELPLREFELLRFLLLNNGRAVTHDQLREKVWGLRGDSASSNTIAVHVRRLRVRLGGAAELAHVRGVGYRLTVHDLNGPGNDHDAQRHRDH